jgi:predicted TIM-barrel fold metal-dependent hydrolase
VSFRVDRLHGRVAWTVDGEDYTKQFYPPNLHDMALTAHGLIAEMDYAGVDVALLHTNPFLSRDAVYQAECVRLYPDRLRSMAPVDEWRILAETDAVIAELTAAIRTHRLHAIKFNSRLAYLDGATPWDGGPYRPFWDAAVALGVPIFFTLGAGKAELSGKMSIAEMQDGYLDEQRTVMRWMERYPLAVCSLTHGFPYRVFLDGDRLAVPDAIWEPFGNRNCHLEVCFPVRIGDLFDFPYREVWPTFEAMVERVGPDQLLWGTDMPFQNRFCTYRQSRVWIEKYCTFLDQAARDKIMGGTAARILGL